MGAGAGFASGWRSREAERALMQINAAPGPRTTLAIVGCAPIPPTSQRGYLRLRNADTSALATPLADDEAQEVLRRAATPANGTLQAAGVGQVQRVAHCRHIRGPR